MTVRKIAGVLPFLLALALVQPLAGQSMQEHEWTRHRPDAHGPVGLSEDFTLPLGELSVGLKFINRRLEGQGLGTDSVSTNQVFNAYTFAPTELVTQGAQLDVAMGVMEHLTVGLKGTFATKNLSQWTLDPDNANLVWISETRNTGLRDVKLTALYDLFQQGPIRAHLKGGFSVPLGGTDATGEVVDPVNPGGADVEVQLPYQQQLGSGTFDLLPGFTTSIQNETASLGLQGNAIIRVGENDRGWALGDVYTGTVWGAYKASDHISVSMAGRFTKWGNVDGFDEDLALTAVYDSPAYNSLQEGWIAEIPMGLNILMPEGRLSGHRLGVEVVFPVHQSLDWIQFRHDWSVVVGWKKTFSMEF